MIKVSRVVAAAFATLALGATLAMFAPSASATDCIAGKPTTQWCGR